MRIKLKRAAHLGGRDLNPGFHELDEQHSTGWHFKALMADKHLEILDGPTVETKNLHLSVADALKAQQAAAEKKIADDQAAKQPEAPASTEPSQTQDQEPSGGDDEGEADGEGESESEEPEAGEEKPQGKKKTKKKKN